MLLEKKSFKSMMEDGNSLCCSERSGEVNGHSSIGNAGEKSGDQVKR